MPNSNYTSGLISFAGLGSGTDFSTLIDGLLKVEQQRITSLETWKSSWEDKVTEFEDLNTKMLTLKTTLENFDTINEFLAKSTSSSASSIVTATAGGEAEEGTYTVEVGSLATNDVFITASGASSLQTAVTSTNTDFTFSYGGESYIISNISANTDLQTFVNIINSHPASRDRIRASTIYDGTTYHLQLTGLDLGADNQIIISNTGSLIFGASDFNETKNATNSMIRVNGFPSAAGGWIERDTNNVNDVIEGLTLNLKDAAPGSTVQLNVNTDSDRIEENVEAFVDAVNEVRSKILAITKVDDTSDDVKGSILTGNYGIDMISQNLKNITAEKGVGFQFYNDSTGEGDIFSALSQVGILTDADEGSPTQGLLVLDKDELKEALERDPDAVAKLFSTKNQGESDSPDFTFLSAVPDSTAPGEHEIKVVTAPNGKVLQASINGEAAMISGNVITGMYGTAAAGMSIRVNNTTPSSTLEGTVRLKQGKVNELIDELSELTRPFNKAEKDGGPLAVLKENYGDIMDSIDSKIEFEENRIAKMERNLKNKYARLDALLGQYSQIQSQLSSSISQMSSS